MCRDGHFLSGASIHKQPHTRPKVCVLLLSNVVYKHAGGVITDAYYLHAMASLPVSPITIHCSERPQSNVLARPLVHNGKFHIGGGVYVDQSGLKVDQQEATRSGVHRRILHTVDRILEQSAGSVLTLDKHSGPSGSGQFANVVPGSLVEPNGNTVKVCGKILTTICLRKQIRIAEELSMHLYIGLGHPHICAAIDMKLGEDCVVVIFPSLDITIEDMCNNLEGTLDARARFRVMFFLFNALRYLHNTLYLVHRDVKADNVMLSKEGDVKVIDLGSAKRIKQDASAKSIKRDTSAKSIELDAPSFVLPPPPAFRWEDLETNPDTDANPSSTFQDNFKADDVCGALQLVKRMSNLFFDATQPPVQLNLTFTSVDAFPRDVCMFYLQTGRTMPDSEELYQTMWKIVEEDPKRIQYSGWSSDIVACLAKKARKSSSQR
jgi:serine/threonine protein kinase